MDLSIEDKLVRARRILKLMEHLGVTVVDLDATALVDCADDRAPIDMIVTKWREAEPGLDYISKVERAAVEFSAARPGLREQRTKIAIVTSVSGHKCKKSLWIDGIKVDGVIGIETVLEVEPTYLSSDGSASYQPGFRELRIAIKDPDITLLKEGEVK